MSCRPVGSLLGLQARHVFQRRPSFDEVAGASLAQRVTLLRDPQRRQPILAEPSVGGDVSLPYDVTTLLDLVFPMGLELDYEPPASASIAAQATRRGVDPVGLLYDTLLTDEGRAMVLVALNNY